MLALDLVVIALIAIGAFSGHKKGLIGILVSFASLILSIILAFTFQSVVSEAIYNSGVGSKVQDVIEDSMQEMIDDGKTVNVSFYGNIISNITTSEQVSQAAESVTRFIMKGLSFILIFLVVHLICYILRMILNLVFNLPILSSINGMGGTIVGALSVVIKVWLVLAIISFISPLPMFSSVVDYIDKTILIKLLYNNNFVVGIIKAGLNL